MPTFEAYEKDRAGNPRSFQRNLTHNDVIILCKKFDNPNGTDETREFWQAVDRLFLIGIEVYRTNELNIE